jgi:hypothetical protein
MPEKEAGSLDQRLTTLRAAAEQGWRRAATSQGQAMKRYGTELSKFGDGEHSPQELAGSLLKVAVDEGGRYAEEVYRAGLDYYKAVVAFYSDPPAPAEVESVLTPQKSRARRRPVRATATRARTTRGRAGS